MWPRARKIGQIQVYSLTDGRFRLDGGAMFGVVPKPLWEKLLEPDDLNRIPLRTNPLLIQLNGKNILVETGMFEGDEKFKRIHALERDTTVFDGLKTVGLEPSDIHLIVHTHLHYDHAGRNTSSGKPTFKNATHLVQKSELEEATHTHERNRASYRPELWEPLLESGQLETLEGEVKILPGLSVQPAPGHNLGQQIVRLESEGEVLIYTADLMPTLSHAPYAYVLGYDLYPVTCLEQRKHYFPQWAAENAVLVPPHDPYHAFGRFVENARGGFLAAALEENE